MSDLYHKSAMPSRKEGRKEGIKETQLEVAQKLKGKGIDLDLIAESTGLSLSEIDQL